MTRGNSLENYPCLHCGKVALYVSRTKNEPGDTYLVPPIIFTSCHDCHFWGIVEEGAAPRHLAVPDVPTLSVWAAFYFGTHVVATRELIANHEQLAFARMLEGLIAAEAAKESPAS